MSISIHARIDDRTHDKLRRIAEREHQSVSGLVAIALRFFVATQNNHELTLEDRLRASLRKVKAAK